MPFGILSVKTSVFVLSGLAFTVSLYLSLPVNNTLINIQANQLGFLSLQTCFYNDYQLLLYSLAF